MNGIRYFVDTNILIYLLSGDGTLINILDDKQIYISFITEIELLSFKNLSSRDIDKIESMLNNFIIIDINDSIKTTAIRFRKKYNLKIPDSIIAASSYYLNLPLLTSDIDFKSLKEITTILYTH